MALMRGHDSPLFGLGSIGFFSILYFSIIHVLRINFYVVR